jgi:hypothetical protein
LNSQESRLGPVAANLYGQSITEDDVGERITTGLPVIQSQSNSRQSLPNLIKTVAVELTAIIRRYLPVLSRSGGTRSSAATICHFPPRLIQVSVHTNFPVVPSFFFQLSLPCATAASP